MNRAELKAIAKQQIKGNVFLLALIMVVIIAVCSVVNMIPKVGGIVVALVVFPVFLFGWVTIYLDMTRHMTPEIGALFAHFNKFISIFKLTLLNTLFVLLWSLLLVIPGIVKALSYSMAMYVLAENPEIDAMEALNRSKAMMDGHKMELFVLLLSFIGWLALGVVTLGIALIWVIPYMSATITNFYNSIKNTVNAEQTI